LVVLFVLTDVVHIQLVLFCRRP